MYFPRRDLTSRALLSQQRSTLLYSSGQYTLFLRKIRPITTKLAFHLTDAMCQPNRAMNPVVTLFLYDSFYC